MMLLQLALAWTPPPSDLAACTSIANVTITGADLKVYHTSDQDACCALCAANASCVAYTIMHGSCYLKASLAHMSPAPGAATGYMPSALTHYANPRTGCLPDEIRNAVPAVEGFFCSAPCQNDDSWCPPEVPTGITATPQCMVNDPIGYGKHCALSCKDDSECGTGVCSTLYGAGNGLCIYPPVQGRIKLVYGTECPVGWVEKTDLKGFMPAFAPGMAGKTNGEPALGVNETGRVGPHGHSATATISDQGHTHNAAVKDPGHTHSITDPGHTHLNLFKFYEPAQPSSSEPYGKSVDPGTRDPRTTGSSTTGITIISGPTGVTVSNQANASGVTASVKVKPTTDPSYPLAYVLVCERAKKVGFRARFMRRLAK